MNEAVPFALVEIKYRDKPRKATRLRPDQLSEYQSWIAEDLGHRHVLVLSRETLRPPSPLHSMRWTEAAKALGKFAGQSDLVRSLIEHLKEDGQVMEKIDSAALIGFLKRLLCPPRGGGQLAGNLKGSAEFAKLLRNMRVLSDRFSTDFKDAWLAASRNEDEARKTKIATIDFEVCNHLASRVEEKIFDGDGHWVKTSAKDGGSVDVFARHSLGSGRNEWMRIGYLMRFDVESKHSKSNLPAVKLLAFANGSAFEEMVRVKAGTITFGKVTSKAEDAATDMERRLAEALLKVFEEIGQMKLEIAPTQRRALKLLKNALEKRVS